MPGVPAARHRHRHWDRYLEPLLWRELFQAVMGLAPFLPCFRNLSMLLTMYQFDSFVDRQCVDGALVDSDCSLIVLAQRVTEFIRFDYM